MAKKTLEQLQRVDLREAWESESGDFTPWLASAENIALLGDAIGMELEVESQEQSVGKFRADILCRDTANQSWVLIENQLEKTDHGHLGQLIIYAAGLEAATIVWVAAEIRDEHRAALDWLNHITSEQFMFFGLELELWRIGDSLMAPKFKVRHWCMAPNCRKSFPDSLCDERVPDSLTVAAGLLSAHARPMALKFSGIP